VAVRARRTIVHPMSALALALHLVLAAPGPGIPSALPAGLAPRLDPGPFRGSEVLASSLGVLAGDAVVVAGAYYTLKLFANGTIRPTAGNFRTFAYGTGVAALVIPPLTAVLMARLFRADPAAGSFWKALLLAMTGQVAALAAGYWAWPSLWVIPAAQLLAVTAGSTVGLHWGHFPRAAAPSPETRREPADPPPAAASAAARVPLCPDPALARAG
jgi:hypothetical protein